MDAPQPSRSSSNDHATRARPDARPMRVALGAGGLAILSALATGIILPPRPTLVRQPGSASNSPAATQPLPSSLEVQRPIRYVQLSPGETAPPGSTVIKASAPTPLTVVVGAPPPATIRPAPKAAAPTPVIIKTTQSGKVVP